jgi:hypothetical protein
MCVSLYFRSTMATAGNEAAEALVDEKERENAMAQDASDYTFTRCCPSSTEASELTSDKKFYDEIFSECPKAVAVRMQIVGEFDEKQAKLPEKHVFESEDKFLVSFESTDGSKMILYWKNSGSSDFIRLTLVDDDIEAAVKSHIRGFIVDSLAAGKAGE